MTAGGIQVYVPGGEHLPDNRDYTNRFEIRSATSDRLYIVAQNKKTGMFSCSCPGWKTHRTCKHLHTIQQVGRQAAIEVRTLPRIGRRTDAARTRPAKDPTLGYKTYKGPRGDAEEWARAFSYRMGIGEARRVLRGSGRTPLEVLGLAADTPIRLFRTLIKSAYRKLVMETHPDRGGNAECFMRVQAAYEVLEHQWERQGRPQ